MTFPSRSILSLEYCGGECGTEGCEAVVIACDCGTTTHLTVDVAPGEKAEAAFTCSGCHSVTWFTAARAAG